MKYLLIILGSICLMLGIIGIFLPLLPTTPFLLLAAALYFRSSERLYQWLIQQKHLVSYIRNFREFRAIPLRAKIISVSIVWITLIFCAITISEQIWIKSLFIILAISITWHILSYKTLKWRIKYVFTFFSQILSKIFSNSNSNFYICIEFGVKWQKKTKSSLVPLKEN